MLTRYKNASLFTLFTLLLIVSTAHGDEQPTNSAPKQLTYLSGPQGISLAELDLSTGALNLLTTLGDVGNPSFLAIDPKRRFMYAADEKNSRVLALAIDQKNGELTLLNEQPSTSAGPCYLVVDREGKNVLVANYGGETVAVLPLEKDGKLRPASSTIKHAGTSADGKKLDAHPHSINVDSANRYALAADAGLNKVFIYRFDADKGTLTPAREPAFTMKPNSGPRHLSFHPNGRWAYVINEQGNSMTAFAHNSENGTLEELQTISTLPDDFKGQSFTSEVVVHPSGKFLYGANRGHDSIAVFAIDPDSGKLTAKGQTPTGGKWPRNFNIDPTGAYMLVGNQQSNSIVVFRIDPKTGALTATDKSLELTGPECIKFWAPLQ